METIRRNFGIGRHGYPQVTREPARLFVKFVSKEGKVYFIPQATPVVPDA